MKVFRAGSYLLVGQNLLPGWWFYFIFIVRGTFTTARRAVTAGAKWLRFKWWHARANALSWHLCPACVCAQYHPSNFLCGVCIRCLSCLLCFIYIHFFFKFIFSCLHLNNSWIFSFCSVVLHCMLLYCIWIIAEFSVFVPLCFSVCHCI